MTTRYRHKAHLCREGIAREMQSSIHALCSLMGKPGVCLRYALMIVVMMVMGVGSL